MHYTFADNMASCRLSFHATSRFLRLSATGHQIAGTAASTPWESRFFHAIARRAPRKKQTRFFVKAADPSEYQAGVSGAWCLGYVKIRDFMAETENRMRFRRTVNPAAAQKKGGALRPRLSLLSYSDFIIS